MKSLIEDNKKLILCEENIKSIFEYEEYEHGQALMNFYLMIKNDLLNIDFKVGINATKIKISEELFEEISEKIAEDAREAGYPEHASRDNKYSINQGRLMWMNQGPSVEEDLGRNEVIVKEGAFMESK